MNRPFFFSANDRADESVLQILRLLFTTLQSNVDGVLDDRSIEFLHDFRVANRRTRTALSQIKGVLPKSIVDAYSPEFKWLGAVTGPCRDLDVTLIEIDSYRHRPEFDDGSLDPLRQFLDDARRFEHSRVCAALRSARAQTLNEGWGRFLDSGIKSDAESSNASSPIIEVVGPRILIACRRIWKGSDAIGATAPATVLHRIRVDGKKLRYLLEFFSVLYPSTNVIRFIRELKNLQDTLGEFNDTAVQLALIDDFANHLAESPAAQPDLLAAISRLADLITRRQHALRAEFVDRFASFSCADSRRLVKRTIRGN